MGAEMKMASWNLRIREDLPKYLRYLSFNSVFSSNYHLLLQK